MDVPYNEHVLLHYGVKGMKWGERKAEIKGARADRNADARQVRKEIRGIRESGDPNGSAKIKQLRQDHALSDNTKMAANLTRGEQIALTVVGGPLGLTTVAAMALMNSDYAVATQRAAARKRV